MPDQCPRLVRVSIPKWDDYNPRGDVKKPSWYRQESSWLYDPEFTSRAPAVRMTWVALLCLRTQANKSEFCMDPMQTATALGIKSAEVLDAIDALQQLERVMIIRTESVQDPYGIRPYPDGIRPLRDGTGRNGTEQEQPSTDSAGGAVAPPPLLPKPKRPNPAPKPVEPEDIAIAEEWVGFAREASRTVRPDLMAWAQTVRELRQLDGLTHDELRRLLAFVRSDGDWRGWAASLPNMRKRMPNGKLKWENARDKMSRGASSNGAVSRERQREIDKQVIDKVYADMVARGEIEAETC